MSEPLNELDREFPLNGLHFIHPVHVIGMIQLLARYNENGLDAKKVNDNTDVTTCVTVDQAFDMLVDNSEVEILRELLTPKEFFQCWSSYYMFVCNSIVACSAYSEYEEKVAPKVKFLFDIYQKVMKGRKIEEDE